MWPPSWADGLDAYARHPRSLREPTRWNQDKSPENINLSYFHISLYASPADSNSGNYICINKLVDNLHISSYYFKMQIYICLRDLPTQKNSTLPPRVLTHAYGDCKISGHVQNTRILISANVSTQ